MIGRCVVSMPIPFSFCVQILPVFAGMYRVPVNLQMYNFCTFIILGKCVRIQAVGNCKVSIQFVANMRFTCNHMCVCVCIPVINQSMHPLLTYDQ